jgi:nitrile hydratase
MSTDNSKHQHDHTTFQPDIEEPKEDWEFLEIAIRELLIEKNVLSAREIQNEIEAWEKKNPERAAEIIARAWVDEKFKSRLLSDGNKAVSEFGFSIEAQKLVVLENTDKLHHLVVCTLCSCYPRVLLGMPPLWYKSREYRSRAVREPRAVLREFGTVLPETTEIRVVDSTADCRYLVIPKRPQDTMEMHEAALVELITRDSMIGTAEALNNHGERNS